jgi:cell envelope opacity-associated protein A
VKEKEASESTPVVKRHQRVAHQPRSIKVLARPLHRQLDLLAARRERLQQKEAMPAQRRNRRKVPERIRQ